MIFRSRTRIHQAQYAGAYASIALPPAADTTSEQAVARAAIETGVLVLALSASAWIRVYVPFTPVPFTLQTMVVLMAGYVLGPHRATLGILTYVGLGVAGLPLLTGPIGPTFGYLLGFALTPWLTARIPNTATAVSAATLLILGMGTAWLALWTGAPLTAAISMGFLPFLPGDAVKAVIAAKVAMHIEARR